MTSYVYIAIKRGEGYEDVADELVAEDAMRGTLFQWEMAPQPGGVTISVDMLNFLHGARPLESVWFGDKHPSRKGAFWWRHLLPPFQVEWAEPTSSRPQLGEPK